MNNTVIASVSALVFLIIGLFIGKSNKQIEIQTVVKTNIVEKPVEKVVEKIVEKPVKEYVDKYITNVVEKVVEAEIPYAYKRSMDFAKSLLNAKLADSKKIPYQFDSIDVNVYLSDELKTIVSSDSIRNSIELELRKIGLKINENSPYHLYFTFDAMENSDKTQHIYQYEMNLRRLSYIVENSLITHAIYSPIWETSSFGKVGINNTASSVKNAVNQCITTFCNKILESRENN